MAGSSYTSSTYITATPIRVWEAITRPEDTRLWYFDTSVESSWQVGSPVVYRREGEPLFEGTVLEVDAPHLLVTTFSVRFHPEARNEPPCRATWRITQIDQDSRLAVTFDDIDSGSATEQILKDGLAYPLNTLKSILETGKRPTIANVTFDCAEPGRQASFWREVTGFVIDGMTDNWAGLHDPRGTGPRLLFMRVPEPKAVKNRVHLDIRVVDRESEARRLMALGAQHLRTVRDEGQGWIILADPEGNEFCIA